MLKRLSASSMLIVALPIHHDLANHILKSLEYDGGVMFLQPKLTYDFVIDTSKYSPMEGSLALHNAVYQSFGTHFFENSEASFS